MNHLDHMLQRNKDLISGLVYDVATGLVEVVGAHS
jgi:hypothetical protein